MDYETLSEVLSAMTNRINSAEGRCAAMESRCEAAERRCSALEESVGTLQATVEELEHAIDDTQPGVGILAQPQLPITPENVADHFKAMNSKYSPGTPGHLTGRWHPDDDGHG